MLLQTHMTLGMQLKMLRLRILLQLRRAMLPLVKKQLVVQQWRNQLLSLPLRTTMPKRCLRLQAPLSRLPHHPQVLHHPAQRTQQQPLLNQQQLWLQVSRHQAMMRLYPLSRRQRAVYPLVMCLLLPCLLQMLLLLLLLLQ